MHMIISNKINLFTIKLYNKGYYEDATLLFLVNNYYKNQEFKFYYY